jgi:hypothetical protein
MEKAFNKSEAIERAVEAYKNNENLSILVAARIHGCDLKSVFNHFKNKIKPTSNYFVIY